MTNPPRLVVGQIRCILAAAGRNGRYPGTDDCDSALTGSTPYTVLTSSMEPTYPPGTLIVVKPQDADSLRVGDAITFQWESGKPDVVTHRIIAVQRTAKGELRFTTQGDANSSPDPRPVVLSRFAAKFGTPCHTSGTSTTSSAASSGRPSSWWSLAAADLRGIEFVSSGREKARKRRKCNRGRRHHCHRRDAGCRRRSFRANHFEVAMHHPAPVRFERVLARDGSNDRDPRNERTDEDTTKGVVAATALCSTFLLTACDPIGTGSAACCRRTHHQPVRADKPQHLRPPSVAAETVPALSPSRPLRSPRGSDQNGPIDISTMRIVPGGRTTYRGTFTIALQATDSGPASTPTT